MALTATLPWQELIRLRLEERDQRERAHDEIVEHYQRLARHTRILKERNQSLLKAAHGVKASDGAKGAAPGAGTAADNPVRAAYLTSLESQVVSLRDEIATLYKTQGQNAQRLLLMNEQLRERDEASRAEAEELRTIREERDRLARKTKDHAEVMGEKERTIQILQDELSALSLELTQVEARNDNLKKDNASLLQRWLDRMNEEAERMNDANRFYEEVERKRVGVVGEGSEKPAGEGAAAGAEKKEKTEGGTKEATQNGEKA